MVKKVLKNKFPHYPRVSRGKFKHWNEKMFSKYNNERVYRHINPIIRFIEEKRVNSILKLLGKIKRTDNILAAGCGEGYIENKIKRGKITLVDLSKEAIKRARNNSKRIKDKKFVVCDLENLPFKSNFFDKIECSEVVEHVYSPKKMLSELSRVLKPDGILVITFPNEPFINRVKKAFIKLKIFHIIFPNVPKNMAEEWHLRSYDLDSFKKDSRGIWKIIKVDLIPFGFSPVRFAVLCRKV